MVLKFLFDFGKNAAIVFLLNDYFRRNYPSKHNEITINIAYNIICAFSYIQLKFNNILKDIPFMVDFFKEIFENGVKKQSTIEFVKNGCIVNSYPVNSYPVNLYPVNSILNETNIKENSDYDFIVYTDNETTPSNIKIMHKDNTNISDKTYNYELSTIKFILVEVIVNNNVYLIELSNNIYNFYIENNIFNKNFFVYFLHYFHKDKLAVENINTEEFTIKIIDSNVDIKMIDKENQFIKLNKSSYEIIS